MSITSSRRRLAAGEYWGYLHTSRFGFGSFQNWQRALASIFLLVGLSTFLRQQSSPWSKPVDAPASEMGD